MLKLTLAAAAAALLTACATTPVAVAPVPTTAAAPTTWVVQESWVRAHENFLAGEALQGRGSATRDEAIAAAYVAAQFEGFGLTPAPGMNGFVQTAGVTRAEPAGQARLSAEGVTVEQGSGLGFLYGDGSAAEGLMKLAATPEDLAGAAVALVRPVEGASIGPMVSAARAGGVKLLVLRETPALATRLAASGGKISASYSLTDMPASGGSTQIAVLSPAAFDRLAAKAGGQARLDPGTVARSHQTTSNVIGWIEGSDPSAGVLMISAHFDHIGAHDGKVFYGANDDASGTTAMLELARAMAAGGRPKRSLMFVGYGSEELGLLGSHYFAEHPPIPLDRIIANLEIEMIGQQDPNLPDGVMMMTGFDRSNFGPEMKARGALVTADPYPEQNFFERSDNYSLALQGIVAHTVSGWATIPTYHTPDDTIANLNIPFMTRAIQSLVEPLRWMASSDFRPEWTAEGRPVRR